jgi:hypothetical protein
MQLCCFACAAKVSTPGVLVARAQHPVRELPVADSGGPAAGPVAGISCRRWVGWRSPAGSLVWPLLLHGVSDVATDCCACCGSSNSSAALWVCELEQRNG